MIICNFIYERQQLFSTTTCRKATKRKQPQTAKVFYANIHFTKLAKHMRIIIFFKKQKVLSLCRGIF